MALKCNIGMVSLGCAKNLVDSEIALGYLVKQGAVIVEEPKDADVIVINTCGFIDPAKEESIDTILEMAAYKQTGRCKALIVTGCLSARYKEELARELPEIDGMLGINEMDQLPVVVAETMGGEKVQRITDTPFSYDDPGIQRVLAGRPGSAYLKIAEGCSHTCAFCIIPSIRGPLRSREPGSLVREAQQLAAAGVRELNIIAQDATAYGRDRDDGSSLPALLKRLDDEVDVDWIRVLYAYPTSVCDELLSTMAERRKILPYLDLPLQHASDTVLRAMGRPGTFDSQRRLVDRVRDAVPNLTLRSAFIVGFPGETEADFQTLLRFLDTVRFDRVGLFPFSAEEGTAAFRLPEPVSPAVKDRRYREAMELQQSVSLQKNEMLMGRTLDVLIEGVSEESSLVVRGRHGGQAPEIDGQVYLGSALADPGTIVPVRVTEAYPYDLVGDLLETEGRE